MKNLIFMAVTLTSLFSFAGSTNDFHSLIVESAEARKSLSQKLKKSVHEIDAANREQTAQQQRLVFTESESQIENIAVPSSNRYENRAKRLSQKSQMTASQKAHQEKLERLSQEVDESRE